MSNSTLEALLNRVMKPADIVVDTHAGAAIVSGEFSQHGERAIRDTVCFAIRVGARC